jgi:uncharacterized membrane protein YebE (DUF533 family)
MEVNRPNAKEPTLEELKDLEKLRALIEHAIADGKITSEEFAAVKSQAWADGKITPEELDLYTTMVLEKIRSGELVWEF